MCYVYYLLVCDDTDPVSKKASKWVESLTPHPTQYRSFRKRMSKKAYIYSSAGRNTELKQYIKQNNIKYDDEYDAVGTVNDRFIYDGDEVS